MGGEGREKGDDKSRVWKWTVSLQVGILNPAVRWRRGGQLGMGCLRISFSTFSTAMIFENTTKMPPPDFTVGVEGHTPFHASLHPF